MRLRDTHLGYLLFELGTYVAQAEIRRVIDTLRVLCCIKISAMKNGGVASASPYALRWTSGTHEYAIIQHSI